MFLFVYYGGRNRKQIIILGPKCLLNDLQTKYIDGDRAWLKDQLEQFMFED